MLSLNMLEILQRKYLLGDVSFLQETPSTNETAKSWLDRGCPDLSLIAAGAQTHGRGRSGRTWFTNPGSSLAISLILTQNIPPMELIGGITSIAIHEALAALLDDQETVQIKWPNDILIGEKKLCGILIESYWTGGVLKGAIIGIGLNVTSSSLSPDQPLRYPATYMEAHTQHPVNPEELLEYILARILFWRSPSRHPEILNEWNQRLAFKGDQIRAIQNEHSFSEGTLLGIATDGSLKLETADGRVIHCHANEVQIRPTQGGQK